MHTAATGFGFDNGCVMLSRFICERTGVKSGLRNGLFMLNCCYRTPHVREAWWLSKVERGIDGSGSNSSLVCFVQFCSILYN